MKHLFAMAVITIIVIACHKSNEHYKEYFTGMSLPANFPAPHYDLSRNPLQKEIFELGKRLFFEPRLSRNNTISCGSCHIQSASFTHHGHDVSHGIDDRLGTRNPLPLINMAWKKNFFWDGGVFDLDFTAVNAITNPVEMDETVPNVIRKLREHPQYPSLFKNAFGDATITDEHFFKALSQYMLMAVSSNSKYDQITRGEGDATFTIQEQAGYLFFQQKCAGCHKEPLFTTESFHNNGLEPSFVDDTGFYTVSLNPADKYKFMVPTLRNLQYTGPYMHDGRFLTLNRVLEHYRNGMIDSPTLDTAFRQNNRKRGIAMTDEEKENLLAFLGTLNDKQFVVNPLLAEPIIR